jgi:RNA polymerase sigma-70 factor (ECF subfamily)
MESLFERLVVAIREGDRQTADLLVRAVEPYLRGAIRLRLANSKLRRVLDSMDICQSVLADLFARGASGWSGQESGTHIRRKILRMAFNKLVSKARHENPNRGSVPDGCELHDVTPAPSQVVADLELGMAIRSRLSQTEQWLFDENKVKGRTWKEIAKASDLLPEVLRGITHDSLRIRLARAIIRVRQELESDGATDARGNIKQPTHERAG